MGSRRRRSFFGDVAVVVVVVKCSFVSAVDEDDDKVGDPPRGNRGVITKRDIARCCEPTARRMSGNISQLSLLLEKEE
eukprot:scaffold1332_cov166-Amphora_coffeaeformis.AAC.6